MRLANRCDFVSDLCRLTPAQVVAQRPDLLAPVSKDRLYYIRNRPRIIVKRREGNKIAARKYRQNNRERRLESERKYRDENRDAINARRREKRSANGGTGRG